MKTVFVVCAVLLAMATATPVCVDQPEEVNVAQSPDPGTAVHVVPQPQQPTGVQVAQPVTGTDGSNNVDPAFYVNPANPSGNVGPVDPAFYQGGAGGSGANVGPVDPAFYQGGNGGGSYNPGPNFDSGFNAPPPVYQNRPPYNKYDNPWARGSK